MIEVYTKPTCPYCHAAKRVLNELELNYSETDISRDVNKREEMLTRSEGRTTVPQIFIRGVGVGGFTDFIQVIEQGKLPELLDKPGSHG